MARSSLITDVLDLILPSRCAGCDEPLLRVENAICTGCRMELPYTRFHDLKGNQVERLFWGRVDLHAASSMLFFERSSKVQRMMHRLKYKADHSIGLELGRLMAKEIKGSERLKDVEAIVPVPLHRSRQRSRGFNQSFVISTGMGEVLEIPALEHGLERVERTTSQTRKGRLQRWQNVKAAFKVNDSKALTKKHVLLIDDVVTTGATLEGCAHMLLELPETKVSVFTVACAQG